MPSSQHFNLVLAALASNQRNEKSFGNCTASLQDILLLSAALW